MCKNPQVTFDWIKAGAGHFLINALAVHVGTGTTCQFADSTVFDREMRYLDTLGP
jgi:hypothetical protein